MSTLTINSTSGASANGMDTNTATATLINGSTYISGAVLDFRVTSGSAIFSNGTQQISVTTSTLGEATVSFTDEVEESVTLLVILNSNATVYQTTSSSFSAGTGTLSVQRVYNDNEKNFEIGGPHNLFIGAKFYIELSKAVSSTIWTCDDPNVEVKNVNGTGHVSVMSTPSSDVITIKFSNTFGEGEYDVAIDFFVDNYHATRQTMSVNQSQYLGIFKEWGSMTPFGWSEKYCYSISNSGAGYDYLYYINMSSGTTGIGDSRGTIVDFASSKVIKFVY